MGGFNGSGVYVRYYSWTNDANNSVPITASRVDTEDNGFATGLTNCVTRDGQSPFLANLPAGGYKITNLANGSASTDSAALGQVFQIANNLSEGNAATMLTNLGITYPVPLSTGVTGTLPVPNGGTGQVSFTGNAILMGNGTGALLSYVAGVGSLYLPLVSTGAGAAPTYQQLYLDGAHAAVTGILPVANGGTGVATGAGPVALVSGNLTTGSTTALALTLSSYTAYNRLELHIDNMAGGSAPYLQYSTNAGSSYVAGAHYQWTASEWSGASGASVYGATTGTSFALNSNYSGAGHCSWTIMMNGMNAAGNPFLMFDYWAGIVASTNRGAGGGSYQSSITPNAIGIFSASGNFTGGTYSLWGWL